jgi:shikimate kinase
MSTPPAGPAAIFIGPPGAGKSTVGALVAAMLGVSFLDTDSVIEEAEGKPVGDIFVEDGEEAFRGLEQAAAARLIAGHPGVLALGGGAILDPGTRGLLAGQRVIYLETGFAAAVHRTGLDAPRPLLFGNPRARMKILLDERLPIYAELAWRTVPTDDREPKHIAEEIAVLLEPGQPSAGQPSAGQPGTGPPDPAP